jgi:hypothetical protein
MGRGRGAPVHLRTLRIENLKLIRALSLDFLTKDGKPRQWTVLVGENGVCKTSILQAIAMAASGVERANTLADVRSYPDRRSKKSTHIEATFGFSLRYHGPRNYPLSDAAKSKPVDPPQLHSWLATSPGYDVLRGGSSYIGAGYDPGERGLRKFGELIQSKRRDRPLSPNEIRRLLGTLTPREEMIVRMRFGIGDPPDAPLREVGDRGIAAFAPDPLSEARARSLAHWFVAGYGVGRALPSPTVSSKRISGARDRVESLFNSSKQIIGTAFAELLPAKKAAVFVDLLNRVFVDKQILPRVKSVHLQGRKATRSAERLLEAHRFAMRFGESRAVSIPTVWMSQGYQAAAAWIADMIGHICWEARKWPPTVPLDEMEGLCLIDEIDLHLHPRWQAEFIEHLSNAFPRMQFIATTHSPMILPGLDETQIIRLELTDDGYVQRTEQGAAPKLMTGSELYREYFGVDRLHPLKLDQALFRYANLAGDKNRSDAEEHEMQRLLIELRQSGVEPGFEPKPRTTPRTAPKKPTSRKRRKPKA